MIPNHEHDQKISPFHRSFYEENFKFWGLYIAVMIWDHIPSALTFSFKTSLSLSLSLSLLVKEMAFSKLVAFLAVLVVLLPMSALGANNTDPFLGISTLFFVLLADCFGCHIHMNMLHISVHFDLLTQKDHKINPRNTHNNVFFLFFFPFLFGFELQQGCVKKWNVERELA